MKPLSVYVHIPFCTIKCGYCDFNAYAGMDALKRAYGEALVAEVRANGPLFAGRSVRSVGFGGGTPGEVPASDIAAVLDAIRAAAPIEPGAEVTLEANPGTIDGASLRELRAAGVTRLSIGAQSFHTHELRFLDRIHSPEANAAGVELARQAGFERISLDLIYGLPGQALAEWDATLRRAIELKPGHISTYALTVEPGTPLARRVDRGEVVPLDDDAVADLYEHASKVLGAAGYEQYEISNWAWPGHESRHNSVYWTDGEYMAIGAGAHGYVDGERYENVAHPREYIAAATRVEGGTRPAMASSYRPEGPRAMSDWLSLRLRLLHGFEAREFAAKFGRELGEAVGPVLEDCRAAGVLELEPRVRLTTAGRLLHGEIAARFLAHLEAETEREGR